MRKGTITAIAELAEGLNETDMLKLKYWQAYSELANDTPEFRSVFNPKAPRPQHWSSLAVGSSEYNLALLIATTRKQIGVEFYIANNKEVFVKAMEHIGEFEQAVGLKAIVFDKKASGIRLYKGGCDIKKSSELWPEYIGWQMQAASYSC